MLQTFGLISGLLAIISHLPYIWDTIFNKTRPERATWLIWSTLGSIALLSQLAKGATNSLSLPFFETLAALIIFLLSIKRGVGGLVKRDVISLVVASFGLILWWFFQDAAFALILVVIVDFSGAVPTIIKSYEDPESETLSTWIISGFTGLFAGLAVGNIDLILLLYPLYIMTVN